MEPGGKGSGQALDSTPLAGVLILRDAVVLAEGASWVYLMNKDKGGEAFTRIKTPLDRLTDAGWFVTGTIKTNDYIVVTGAQNSWRQNSNRRAARRHAHGRHRPDQRAQTATLHRYVPGYGTVETAPATTNAPAAGVSLAAPVAGVITKIAVVEGQHVEKGDLVAELNSGAMRWKTRNRKWRGRGNYTRKKHLERNLQSAEAQLALLRISRHCLARPCMLTSSPVSRWTCRRSWRN